MDMKVEENEASTTFFVSSSYRYYSLIPKLLFTLSRYFKKTKRPTHIATLMT